MLLSGCSAAFLAVQTLFEARCSRTPANVVSFLLYHSAKLQCARTTVQIILWFPHITYLIYLALLLTNSWVSDLEIQHRYINRSKVPPDTLERWCVQLCKLLRFAFYYLEIDNLTTLPPLPSLLSLLKYRWLTSHGTPVSSETIQIFRTYCCQVKTTASASIQMHIMGEHFLG